MNEFLVALAVVFIWGTLSEFRESRKMKRRKEELGKTEIPKFKSNVPDEMVEAIAELANEDVKIINQIDNVAMTKYLDKNSKLH